MPEPDLLVTKFTAPPVRSIVLQCSHLFTVLDQSRSFPLTLLSASAGFGKTTLLSAWARQSTSQVAWLTLDEQDNESTHFWAYVIAALRHSGSSLGEAAEVMLHSLHSLMLTGALTSLINELAALSQETVLILDDYHLISEQAIHESLQFVLDHLPACLHLLLASRVDPPLPLARLRARGQMVEIREMDLRLNGEEAARFLTQVMNLSLSEEEIGRLETCTEGWIAGLQLAALASRRHQDASAFIQTFPRHALQARPKYISHALLRRKQMDTISTLSQSLPELTTATTSGQAVEAEGLVKTYSGDVQALKGVSISIRPGTVFALEP